MDFQKLMHMHRDITEPEPNIEVEEIKCRKEPQPEYSLKLQVKPCLPESVSEQSFSLNYDTEPDKSQGKP